MNKKKKKTNNETTQPFGSILNRPILEEFTRQQNIIDAIYLMLTTLNRTELNQLNNKITGADLSFEIKIKDFEPIIIEKPYTSDDWEVLLNEIRPVIENNNYILNWFNNLGITSYLVKNPKMPENTETYHFLGALILFVKIMNYFYLLDNQQQQIIYWEELSKLAENNKLKYIASPNLLNWQNYQILDLRQKSVVGELRLTETKSRIIKYQYLPKNVQSNNIDLANITFDGSTPYIPFICLFDKITQYTPKDDCLTPIIAKLKPFTPKINDKKITANKVNIDIKALINFQKVMNRILKGKVDKELIVYTCKKCNRNFSWFAKRTKCFNCNPAKQEL